MVFYHKKVVAMRKVVVFVNHPLCAYNIYRRSRITTFMDGANTTPLFEFTLTWPGTESGRGGGGGSQKKYYSM